MALYRRAFEERIPAIERAVREMPGDISETVPGLTKERLLRFFKRFAVLLGRLDKKGAKHPQFLWVDGLLASDGVLSQTDAAIASIANGAAYFAQNHLSPLLRYSDALEKAIGADPDEIKTLAGSVAADMAIAVSQTDDLRQKGESNVNALQALEQSARELLRSFSAIVDQAKADAERAGAARRSVEQMVNPDGRNKTSLEALARRARERIAEIDAIFSSAGDQLKTAEQASLAASAQKADADTILDILRELRKEAEQVLNLSSQAGLAASYKTESQRLEKRSTVFTIILYSSAIVTILLAAFYVLPELNKALTSTNNVGIWESLSFTILRASVLAPLIYVIYFTTKRISSLEILRMDYAEKAAASLAYSGYREQVDSDEDLLRQLKGSLLIKFAEHPERLLRVEETSTAARIKTAGFEAETLVGTKPAPANGATQGAES
jgi:hypothetical protein